MGWLRVVGSLKLQVSSAKEPYERDDIHSASDRRGASDSDRLFQHSILGGKWVSFAKEPYERDDIHSASDRRGASDIDRLSQHSILGGKCVSFAKEPYERDDIHSASDIDRLPTLNTWRRVTARPNQSFMFPYSQLDFSKVFYLSFSTNIENPVPEILFSKIGSSAQDHTVLVVLLNLVGFFISA